MRFQCAHLDSGQSYNSTSSVRPSFCKSLGGNIQLVLVRCVVEHPHQAQRPCRSQVQPRKARSFEGYYQTNTSHQLPVFAPPSSVTHHSCASNPFPLAYWFTTPSHRLPCFRVAPQLDSEPGCPAPCRRLTSMMGAFPTSPPLAPY